MTTADSEYTPATDAAAGRTGSAGDSGAGSGGDTASSADSAQAAAAGAAVPHGAPASAGLVFDDPLDRPSPDDTDRGWGDPLSGSADDDFTRFLSEKPPHHL